MLKSAEVHAIKPKKKGYYSFRVRLCARDIIYLSQFLRSDASECVQNLIAFCQKVGVRVVSVYVNVCMVMEKNH